MAEEEVSGRVVEAQFEIKDFPMMHEILLAWWSEMHAHKTPIPVPIRMINLKHIDRLGIEPFSRHAGYI
ncbi:hypothetical protein Forpe1208_v007095 [Fusarium oxysporum f. sp. rapae]|uniref:Uncharacterized protein n=1 Tax=Fusarium oxysporum f. sp. rapae TaxID=485398 RepID=A0A8J5NUT7_FUSOX|nr:hypothetical protein Forpe1208_v007095 [Fusarium oxysporum f. sp. rapae]